MPLFKTHRIGKENTADEDHALVKRLRSGDDFALNEIMQLYKERIYRLAWRYMGNEDAALDVTQETLQSFISISTNTIPPINSAPGFFRSRSICAAIICAKIRTTPVTYLWML